MKTRKEAQLIRSHLAKASDKETPAYYKGLHYQDGEIIATDGRNVIALRREYPAEFEGKTLDNKGVEIPGPRLPMERSFGREVNAIVTLVQLEDGLGKMQAEETARRMTYAQAGQMDEYTPAPRALRITDADGDELCVIARPTLEKFVTALNAIKARSAVICKMVHLRAGTGFGRCACTVLCEVYPETIITTITI